MFVMNSEYQTYELQQGAEDQGPLTFEKIWKMFQETKKIIRDTAEKVKETTEQVKEMSREIRKMEHQFTSMWGKLVESLVRGDLISLLNRRNISVRSTLQRVEGIYNKRRFEFDIIAVNGVEIVVVEVKTTLKNEDIRHFIDKLGNIKEWLPDYKDKKIYGAVAFIHTEENVVSFAESSGLLVIRATGSSASIINQDDFYPRIF
jgi:hypothetical protein